MDIVFAADDNYAAYLCVAAKSVEAAIPIRKSGSRPRCRHQ